jgi:HPt (histidine-containing phosphotransfer) domain-containing protein
MFEQLKREVPIHLEAIKSSCEAQDWESLCELTHKLHGSTSSCGASALDYAVQQLDSACRDASIEKVQKYLKVVELESTRLLKS